MALVIMPGIIGWLVWKKLASAHLQIWLTAVSNNTQFFVIDHPVATGVTNDYFEQIGTQIRRVKHD